MSGAGTPAVAMEATRDGFLLSGPVTIATASQVIDAARDHWPDSGVSVIDFSGVIEADSAALALIFKWQRDAARKGRQIRCVNIPANVFALARLYGVEDLIQG